MNLIELGWNADWQEALDGAGIEGAQAGRVVLEHKRMYRVYTEDGEVLAEVSGSMRYQTRSRADYPAVGDWVAVRVREQEGRATIHALLPRKSAFVRKVAGSVVEEQIVAANVDVIFLILALNGDFNLRRLERYLVMAWESGASPVVILSKADLCASGEEVAVRVGETEAVAPGVPVHAVSSLLGAGVEELRAAYLGEGRTAAVAGSSGAGKSTLINALLGREAMETGGIREDDARGRHTTTHRELLLLPGGGVLIDTPGMRELQLWEADSGLSASFGDVESLAGKCRFPDCSHRSEPGCAVQHALQEGSLDHGRYDSYVKLQKELAYLARKENKALQHAETDRWKKIAKEMRRKPPK
ncbi:ribosome small subunit-dependent GTPase A [Paenibacillus sp. FJAT-26967]|uniref:ribosome small subunit-dependent GTPase A n=1 Tax=Paenibacillus sp. FJAT-26967 TaxID=1729690 RepID=UPI0008386AC6|nr:ribosome small subunit-dependent GTPase A [Paenibacillus sp. FJAT-26967]